MPGPLAEQYNEKMRAFREKLTFNAVVSESDWWTEEALPKVVAATKLTFLIEAIGDMIEDMVESRQQALLLGQRIATRLIDSGFIPDEVEII